MFKQFFLLPTTVAVCLFNPADRATAQPFKSLYSFNQGTTDGVAPRAQLTISSNVLYGTTPSGGTAAVGTIFKINTDGTAYKTIYNFTANQPPQNTNSDGASPTTRVVVSGNTLYGDAYDGGTGGLGTIFSLNTSGSNFTTLFSFPAGTNGTEGLDGEFPTSWLILAGNILYGSAGAGGSNGAGTIFSISTNGTNFSLLHVFQGSDGVFPVGDLTLSSNTLYGMTVAGNIFRVDTNGGEFTNLFSFPKLVNNTNNAGSSLEGALAVSGDRIYGAADGGGNTGNGTIFSLNTDGTGFTNMYNFTGGADGANPYGGLILAGDTLYGTTQYGGLLNDGTIFSIKTNGLDFTILYSFAGANGAVPEAPLLYANGNLYGTTAEGGSTSAGTIFSLGVIYVQISATPTNGAASLTVNFTSSAVDNETNAITSWNWNFGDGSTSTAQNPSHTYTTPGIYTATLTATDANGISIIDSSPSITVNPSIPPSLSGATLSGSNLVLNALNGLLGSTYVVLSSTNLALPLSKWTPVATNHPSLSGNFTITLTNTFTRTLPSRFYILQTH